MSIYYETVTVQCDKCDNNTSVEVGECIRYMNQENLVDYVSDKLDQRYVPMWFIDNNYEGKGINVFCPSCDQEHNNET